MDPENQDVCADQALHNPVAVSSDAQSDTSVTVTQPLSGDHSPEPLSGVLIPQVDHISTDASATPAAEDQDVTSAPVIMFPTTSPEITTPVINPEVAADEEAFEGSGVDVQMVSIQQTIDYAIDVEQHLQQQQLEQLQHQLSQFPVDSGSWSLYQSPDDYGKFKGMIGLHSTSLGQSYCGDGVAFASKEFAGRGDNYLRGCKWSQDGNFILTNSNDDVMRVFEVTPDIITGTCSVDTEMVCSRRVHESELVYDYCWFPSTDVAQPDTCCFATSCRDTPIHLFNFLTGDLMGTYRPYNHVDEIVAAHSLSFTCDGRYLLSGFNKTIRIFHTQRPGRDFTHIPTTMKDRVTQETKGQQGIISCFAAHPSDPTIFAAGSFRGDVALYSAPSGDMSSLFRGQQGGVTHMIFSHDGLRLYAGGRKDPEINCWDIRNPGKQLYVMYRYVQTNQRMYFDLDSTGRYLLSGNHNGKVSVWDVESTPFDNPVTGWPQIDPIANFQAHRDAANGCSMSPKHPLLATCSGQRHFSLVDVSSSDDDEDDSDGISDGGGEETIKTTHEKHDVENSLRLWRLQLSPHDPAVVCQ